MSQKELEEEKVEDEKQDSSLSVSELTDLIKTLFHTTFSETKLCIIGEISNFKPSKNNLFFTLKDDSASINAVMWNYASRKDKMKDIKDGKKVKVHGTIVVFPKSGTYNLNSYSIELLGVGDLHQQYVDLKDKYSKLGYFNEDIKKKLPTIIDKVGIITAGDGAALQDFLYVLKKNNFSGKVYIKSCVVQGNDCPLSVSQSIDELDQLQLDVIVIARGGGAFEDLFGFSSEQVIESIYAANTCIISAIGHEVDFMLSDFVADIRAPTPSIAGEIISCKKDTSLNLTEIDQLVAKIREQITLKMKYYVEQINTTRIIISSPNEFINQLLRDIDSIRNKLLVNIRIKLSNIESNLNKARSIVTSMDYAVIYAGTQKITSLVDFKDAKKKKKKLKIQFYDGQVVFDPTNIQYLSI